MPDKRNPEDTPMVIATCIEKLTTELSEPVLDDRAKAYLSEALSFLEALADYLQS